MPADAPLTLPPIDPDGPPAHVQIATALSGLAADGRLSPGDRLPAERDLAALAGVSRATLRQALSTLERRGLLVRSQGRQGGTFIAAPQVERDLTTFTGLSAQLRRQGMAAGALVRSAALVAAREDVAEALALQVGSPVYEVVRLRLADGAAIALERSSLPATLVPGLLEHPLDASLYDVLERVYGLRPARAMERLEPVIATPQEASALDVEPGAPLMRVERTAYASDDRPLEHATDLFRGDRTRVVVWTSNPGEETPA